MAFHSKGGGIKGNGTCGQESESDTHIINQLRKIIDMQMSMVVKFQDRTYVRVNFETAQIILEKYNYLRTSSQKEDMTNRLWASAKNIMSFVA